MADIGSLAFKLTASGAQATAEMDRVRRSMQEIDREAKKSGSENWIQSRIGILGGDAKSRLDEAKAFAAERYKSSTLAGRYDADSGAIRTVSRAEVESLNARRISLEGVAKTAGLAAAGINGMAIATKAFSGDMMGAADLVKQLPFGIGQTARALEGILGAWTGISAEIEHNNALARAQVDSAVAMNDQIRTRIKLEQEARDFVQDQAVAERAAGLEGVAAQEQKLNDSEARALRQITDEANKAKSEALKARNEASRSTRTSSSESWFQFSSDSSYKKAARFNAETATQRVAIQQNYQKTVEDIERQAEEKRKALESRTIAERMALRSREAEDRRALADKQNAQEQKLAEDSRRAAEQEALAKLAASRRAASDVQTVEAEIAAKVLEIQGRQDDAERVLTEDRYRRRIEAAREAGNAALASALGEQKILAISNIGRGGPTGPEQLAEQVVRGRFLQGTGESKTAKMPIIGDPQQTEYLKSMADALVRGVTARAG